MEAAPIRLPRSKRIGVSSSSSDEKKQWLEASIRHSTAEASWADDAKTGNDESKTPQTAAAVVDITFPGNKPRKKQFWQNNGFWNDIHYLGHIKQDSSFVSQTPRPLYTGKKK